MPTDERRRGVTKCRCCGCRIERGERFRVAFGEEARVPLMKWDGTVYYRTRFERRGRSIVCEGCYGKARKAVGC